VVRTAIATHREWAGGTAAAQAGCRHSDRETGGPTRAAAPGHRRSGRSSGQMAGRVGPGSSGRSSTPVHVEQVALPHSQPLCGALWPHASGAEGVREVVRGLGGGHACQARRRLACTLVASNRDHHVPPRARGHQPPIRAGCAGFKAGARAQGLVINGDTPLITVCCQVTAATRHSRVTPPGATRRRGHRVDTTPAYPSFEASASCDGWPLSLRTSVIAARSRPTAAASKPTPLRE
jgi:hypothetical protein